MNTDSKKLFRNVSFNFNSGDFKPVFAGLASPKLREGIAGRRTTLFKKLLNKFPKLIFIRRRHYRVICEIYLCVFRRRNNCG